LQNHSRKQLGFFSLVEGLISKAKKQAISAILSMINKEHQCNILYITAFEEAGLDSLMVFQMELQMNLINPNFSIIAL